MTEKKVRPDLEGYVLFDKLYHNDLIPWIVRAMSYHTVYRYLFFGILFFTGFVTILWFLMTSSWNSELLIRILFFFSGFLVFLLLIPLHEYIHVLAYRYCGAHNARIRANWKYFYFYAWAKGFVATRKDLRIIALSPFIIINTFLVLFIFFLPDIYRAFFFGMILMHIAGSYGDFALLNYYEKFKNKGMISYDDEGISYFFIQDDLKS